MGNVGSIQTAKGEIFTNAHVLSQSRAGLGYFVLSGCDVNQSGTPGMSVVVDSGYIQSGWGTVQKTVVGDTIVITAAHPTLPRIDTIYIDSNGTKRVYDGTATAISPGDKTNFKQMSTPAPGTNIPSGVIIALVYVAAGDTAITNAEILDIATYGPLVVEAPTTITSGKIPYWSSTAKTLADGYTVGTTANCLIQLDSSARLPAVSGDLLTSISHANLSNLSADDHTQYIRHNLATNSNDFLVSSGSGAFVKKTLAETKTILGLGSAAYTASTDYAVAAKGVTNGDSHDHSGGDGAQIDHVNLANKGSNSHATIDGHIASSSNPHSTTYSQVGAEPANANIQSHIGSSSNPHGTTYGQVGAPATGLKTTTQSQNNTTLASGIYDVADGLKAADGITDYLLGWWHLINMCHSNPNGFNSQIAVPLAQAGPSEDIYWRHASGGTWSEWRRIISEALGDAKYAPIAKGVTNGDSHNHDGGDGAQIAYSSLSGTPARKWGGSFVFGDGSSTILAQEMGIGPFPIACTITEVKIREQSLLSSTATITLHIHDYNAAIGSVVDTFSLSGSTYSETGLSWSVAANKWVTIKVASPVTMCQLAVGLVFEAV